MFISFYWPAMMGGQVKKNGPVRSRAPTEVWSVVGNSDPKLEL